MRRLLLAIALLLAASDPCAPPAWAGMPDGERVDALAAWLDSVAGEFQLPGLAAVVFTEGSVEPVLLRGAGVSESAPMGLGSCSKTITAAAALVACDEADVEIDTPVADLIPGLSFAGNAQHLTVRQLLNHRSGFSRSQGFATLPSLREIEEEGLQLTPRGGKRGEYGYSNLNYALLGLVIEKLTGEPYADYLRRRLFEPLGMKSSSAETDPTGLGGPPHHQYMFGYPYRVGPPAPAPSAVPAGFVRASVDDLARFWGCLAAGGTHAGERVIPEEVVEQMFTPVGGEFGYGMGATRGFFDPVGVVYGHEGATPTAYACAAWFPDRGYGLIVLANVNLFDPFTDRGSVLFQNGVRVLEGQTPENARPYHLWLRWGVVGLLVRSIVVTVRRLWRACRAGSETAAPRPGLGTLLVQLALPPAIWWVALWWFATPLEQAFRMTPDLIGGAVGITALGMLRSLIDYWRPEEGAANHKQVAVDESSSEGPTE